MAVDVETLVGKENMQPSKLNDVVRIIMALDQPGQVKRYLLARWARLVGLPADRQTLDQVAPHSEI
jgi:hypothetical protein